MKKVLLTISLAAFSASVFAQGTVQLLNLLSANGLKAPVYGVEAPGSAVSKTGNTSAGLPIGTQVYLGTPLSGSAYCAQLFGGLGTLTADVLTLSNMAMPVVTFRTGSGAGYTAAAGILATLPGVQADSPLVTVQLRAWDNSSGQYPTWAQAETAWRAGLIAAGMSPVLTGGPVGGGTATAFLMVGLQSFNIYYVPEPTTMALAGLGAAALLIFRRRN